MRNYGSEYKRYQKQGTQKKNRASRNAARSILLRQGKVKKGDGKDVSHRNGNPRDNRTSNLAVKSKTANRSFRRTRNAKKLIRRS